ncbi:MAG: alpha/beta fold hydrolase [Opitutaceae bacterium]|nr:alpha/beta fold hydrolase [Opitutaceae bacterium]
MIALAHRDFGTQGRPSLVILHGLLGSSRNWQTVARDLSPHFHVMALDLRNHGSSPHADDCSFEAMVGDVLAWMDRKNIPRTTLLGHSLGGKVAMLLACRHVDRVERLIVVDIAPKAYLSHAHRAEFAAMNELDLATLKSRGEAELRFEARVPDWGMRKFLATNLERTEDGSWRWAVNLPTLTRALQTLEDNSLLSRDRYCGPARFIVGGRSRYVSASDESEIRLHFPHASLKRIENSGHNPHMEAREEFVAEVLEFALEANADGQFHPG